MRDYIAELVTQTKTLSDMVNDNNVDYNQSQAKIALESVEGTFQVLCRRKNTDRRKVVSHV